MASVEVRIKIDEGHDELSESVKVVHGAPSYPLSEVAWMAICDAVDQATASMDRESRRDVYDCIRSHVVEKIGEIDAIDKAEEESE